MSEFDPAVVEVAIANGQALSAAADLQIVRLHRINMPAGWTAATITFQVSDDGEEWADLYLATDEYEVTAAAANRSIVVDQALFFGVRWLKVRSGTAAAAVNQGAERILKLVTAPQ